MAIRNDAGLMLEGFLFIYLFISGEGREDNIQCMVETGSHGEAGCLFHRG